MKPFATHPPYHTATIAVNREPDAVRQQKTSAVCKRCQTTDVQPSATHLAIPMLDNVVSLILAQHAIMRGVEAQQTREMRIDVQPLRGEDAQHMRVRHQQHVMTGIEQRHHRVDRIAGARGGLLNRLARAIVHRNLLAAWQRLNPVALQRFGKGTRTVAPYIPLGSRQPRSPPGVYALRARP